MRKRLMQWAYAAALMVAMTACSGDSGMKGLLEQVPADMDVVFVGDVETIVASAGGSIDGATVKLPSYLTDELSGKKADELDKFNTFLKGSGVDPNTLAVAYDFDDDKPIMVFALDDEDKFKKAIEDEGFREKDVEEGVTYYSKKVYASEYNSDYDDYGYIAVSGSYAYWIENVWVGSDFKPMEVLPRMIRDAKSEPFSSTVFSDYITSGNAGGVAVKIPQEFRQSLREQGLPNSVVELYDGVMCFKGELGTNEAKVTMTWFDEEGNVKKGGDFNKYFDVTSKVNAEALAYMDKSESLVYAVSLKGFDWGTYMDDVAEAAKLSRSDRAAMAIVKSYLEKFDGTMAIGIGLENGIESMGAIERGREPMKELAVTIVCETKPGKATGVVNDIKGLLESQRIDFDDKPSGLSLSLPGLSGTIYVEAEGNLLVLSNRKVDKADNNIAVKNVDFGNYFAAAGLVLGQSNPLISDLGLDHGVKVAFTVDGEAMEATMTLAFDGDGSRGVVEKFARAIIGIAGREEQMERKYESGYGANKLSDDYYTEVDTVAVDPSMMYADSVAVID